MKRVLALLLCLVVCLSLLPAGFAADIEIADEPEEIKIDGPELQPLLPEEPQADGTVKYRALLIAEVFFSFETANRNRGDVQRINAMLKRTFGPEGGAYSVSRFSDLSAAGIRDAIGSTFADADSNDVSLFFIATHGVTDVASGPDAGAIVTIEQLGAEEGYLRLGTLADWLKAVPGKVIVLLGSCGSGAAVYSNGKAAFSPDFSDESDTAFTEAVVRCFEEADGERSAGAAEPQTGEFRNSKFYVLTAAAHQESSWGQESSTPYNFFPYLFAEGAGLDMPADVNGDLSITLDEMYQFCSQYALGPYNDGTGDYYQHVQVYPTNSSYPLFAAKLSLSESSLSLPVHDSVSLWASTSPSVVLDSFSWTSSNKSVATVDADGRVTAKKYGKTTITGKIPGTKLSATCRVQTLFWDVADSGMYYFKPVYWAAEKGITTGYDYEYFAPQEECTREQMMTFLWRLAGKPEPRATESPFSDVQSGAYFCKAVLWGVEKGITAGYSEGEYAGMFGVGLPCTREDAMTFLWRLARRPEPASTENPFSDLDESAYYYRPVLWASENVIAKGYDDGTYGVGLSCLREHMVTFLYRYWKKFM